jgi:hypothetical protein
MSGNQENLSNKMKSCKGTDKGGQQQVVKWTHMPIQIVSGVLNLKELDTRFFGLQSVLLWLDDTDSCLISKKVFLTIGSYGQNDTDAGSSGCHHVGSGCNNRKRNQRGG